VNFQDCSRLITIISPDVNDCLLPHKADSIKMHEISVADNVIGGNLHSGIRSLDLPTFLGRKLVRVHWLSGSYLSCQNLLIS
jgi:hypothetical protein